MIAAGWPGGNAAGVTTAIPCRAARPDRGWTKPAYPSGIATASPVPTSARSPGPSDLVRARRGRGRSSRRRPGRERARPRGAAGSRARSPAARPCRRARRRDTGAKRGTSRCGSWARMTTPSGDVQALVDRRRRARRAPQRMRPSSYGTSRRTGRKRSANRFAIAAFQLVEPFAGERRDLKRSRGTGWRGAGGVRGSTASILLRTSSIGRSEPPISRRTRRRGDRSSRSSGSDASATWRTRSA